MRLTWFNNIQLRYQSSFLADTRLYRLFICVYTFSLLTILCASGLIVINLGVPSISYSTTKMFAAGELLLIKLSVSDKNVLTFFPP